MSTTTYTQLAGDSNINVLYTSTEPVGDNGYPDESNYAILGPIYAPRVHGIGLSAFEIASSDIVAFTLQDSHALSMGLLAGSNMSYMMTTSSNHSFELATYDSNVRITLDGADKTLDLYAANSLGFATGGSIALTTPDSNLLLRAGQAGSATNRSELLLRDTGVFDVYASDSLNLDTASNLSLSAENEVDIRRGNELYVKLMNDDSLDARALNYEFSASNYYAFSVDGSSTSNVLEIKRDNMTLYGNLEIHGTINSISQTVTQLEVEDKTIKLAVAGNDTTSIIDGQDNDQAGVIVAGYPSGVDSTLEENQKKYAKYVRWNYGTGGIDEMLTDDGALKESYWDVRGGSLRMTSYKASTSEELGFGMRINGKDELEMVRFYEDNGSKKASAFIRFGRKT